MRYRSKPSEVEAVQWNGDNYAEVRQFAGSLAFQPGERNTLKDRKLLLRAGTHGAQGWVPVPDGDWVVRGGEPAHYWPVNAEHFAAKYELAHQVDGTF